MTVPSTARRAGPFTGTGSLASYPFNFKVFQASDLEVTIADTDSVESTLVLDSSALVTLNVDQDATPGGYVQYAVGGIATALPSGYRLAITGDGLPFEQTADLPQGGNFSPAVIENALDNLEMQIQRLEDSTDRAIALPVTAPAGISTALPVPVASNLLGWSADGLSLTNYVPSTDSAAALQALLASTAGSFNVGHIDAGAGAVPTTTRAVLRETFSIQRRGAVGNGTADDTAKIQAGIDAMPNGGILDIGEGTFRITDKLVNRKGVLLKGRNPGSASGLGNVTPATRILWDGPLNGTMLECGGNGILSVGGGVRNLMLDGNGGAGNPLRIHNLQRANFKDLMINGVTQFGILVTNTLGVITMRCIFDNLYVNLNDGVSNINATGLYLNGTNSGGADGVTLCSTRRLAIDHRNGHGVLVGQIGDAWNWDHLQTYRGNGDTGAGVVFSALRSGGPAICGYHVFVNPIVHAGFIFSDTGLHDGTRIINDSQGDIDPSVQRLYGAGAGEVEYTGGIGFSSGRGLIPDPHRITVRDPMHFIRHDTTNNVLHTADRNWRTALVGTGSITEAGQAGGAVRLTTGTTINDSVAVFDASSAGSGSGWFAANQFNASLVFFPVTVANVVQRVGFFNSTGDSPNDGAYWEGDPSVSTFWQVVTRKAGVETRVTTPLTIFAAMLDFSIWVAPAGQFAVFKYRTDGNTSYGVGGVVNTNVPLIGLPCMFRVKTKAASAASMDVYSATVGTRQECRPAFGG